MVIRLRRGREVDQRWLDAVRAGLVGVCPVVEAELARATASKVDRDQLRSLLRSLFGWHPMPDDAWRFVERTQDEAGTEVLRRKTGWAQGGQQGHAGATSGAGRCFG